jgi:hypothetical protein
MLLLSSRFDAPRGGLNKWRPEGGERAFHEREHRYRLQWEQMLQQDEPSDPLDFLK